MGIRCYQEVGLKPEAVAWIEENAERVPLLVCPDCGTVVTDEPEVVKTKHRSSFYTDGPDLRTYQLKDGTRVSEIVQAEPWSSGPMAFFCLKRDNGERLFEWSYEEIDERVEN